MANIYPTRRTFNRSESTHGVSLCDMRAKYAGVVSTAEILTYFSRLPTEIFDLPMGKRSAAGPIKEAAE
jgi:hypothetical protein